VGYRDVALRNGFRAVWSTPVLSDENTVLGTFTMFHGEPGLPDYEPAQLIEMAVQMARLAIQSKQDEERLRASEKEYREVIDNIPAIAWTSRPDGRGEFTNRSWQEYTGQSAEEAAGWGWASSVHPEDAEKHLANWRRAVASGEPFESEARYRRRDGVYRCFLARGVPLRNATGNIQRWYGILVDIEDRKRAREALQKSEQLLKFVLETLPISVVVMDRAGDIILANDATRRAWAGDIILSGAERLARVKGFWHSTGKQLSPDEWASAVALSEGREAVNDLIDIEAFDGRRKTIENTAAPIRNSDGAIIGAVVVNREVTDRVNAETSLRETAQRLQHLSRRLLALQEEERRSLSRELHDRLGETLTALSINLAMLRGAVAADADATARIEDSAALVKSTAAVMENLVGELRPPMLDDHGLAPALEWYGRQFAARVGVKLVVRAAEPRVRLAPEVEIALFRIAQEALNNVAKHARAGQVVITLRTSASDFVMTIADDGIGLPRAAQAERSRPGLGFATMRERAQAVGGAFAIEPSPNGPGTQLSVRVPL
jgi:PAS domain S-box-containing protein